MTQAARNENNPAPLGSGCGAGATAINDAVPGMPLSPKAMAEVWEPPGIRKDRPPPPVPAAIRNDIRQLTLALERAQ
jgi:hypothetical protein